MRAVANEIRVTAAVWDEVTSDHAKPGVPALWVALDAGVIVIVPHGDPFAFPDLGRGESSVLSAASEHRASVILDERKARALYTVDVALRESIADCVGVVGVLLRAKQLRIIDAIRPLIEQLLADEFRLSNSLVRAVLDAAGE